MQSPMQSYNLGGYVSVLFLGLIFTFSFSTIFLYHLCVCVFFLGFIMFLEFLIEVSHTFISLYPFKLASPHSLSPSLCGLQYTVCYSLQCPYVSLYFFFPSFSLSGYGLLTYFTFTSTLSDLLLNP